MGRVAARLLAVFESAFGEFANAMMAEKPQTQRDVVRTMRATWRHAPGKGQERGGRGGAALA